MAMPHLVYMFISSGAFGLFSQLGGVSNAAMGICTQLSVESVSISLGHMPRNGTAEPPQEL